MNCLSPRRAVALGLFVFVGCLADSAAAQSRAWVEMVAGRSSVHVQTEARTTVVRYSEDPIVEAAVRPVPGSAALAVTWSEVRDGLAVPYYALSLDGVEFHDAVATEYDLTLRYARFDPLLGQPTVPAALSAAGLGSRLWIVQLWHQTLPDHLALLDSLGVERHAYLWYHAHIVSMDGGVAAAVSALPFVRAVVSFHPAYKLDETLLAEQVSGAESAPRRVNILGMRRGLLSQGPIAKEVERLGGRVEILSPNSFQMQATLTPGQIRELARLDDVHFIDLWAAPEAEVDMDIARSFHGAVAVEVVGFTGVGVRGELADSGTNVAHPEFQLHPPIPHGPLVNSSHGSSTFGQIFAQGLDPQARGLLRDAQGIAAAWGAYATGNRYDDTAQLVNPALVYKCLFQSNSGGHPLTTQYTTDSSEMDRYQFDFPTLAIIQSQSNTGNQSSRAGAWGKNTVSIGGVAHGNTLSKTDDSWTSASIGPAADGRVKPELASYYDNIYTTGQTTYTSTFGGTSGATPIVAGCFGLFYEMWHNAVFGNPTGNTVFDSAPQNTTARAFMIASATQWDWVGGTAANADITRDVQGWGHPDLATLYAQRNNLFYVNETDVLTVLQTRTHTVTVAPGQAVLKASLVWRDNPGTVSSTQHLINDLDLRVTSPGGTVYWGNFGLTNSAPGAAGENLWSVAGGSKDPRNSVENVFIQNPAAGNWTVEVIVANLNGDNHVETPTLDCDYALCVIGGTGNTVPGFVLTSSFDGFGNLSVGFSGIPVGTSQGFTLVAESQSAPLGSGGLLGINPTALTFYALTLPAQAGDPFHWVWPVSGVFPDTPLVVPAGALAPSLFPIDLRGVGLNGAFGITGFSNLRRIQ